MEQKLIRVAHIMGKWLGGGVESVVMNYYRHIDRNKIQFDFICDNDSTDIPYEEIEKLGGRVYLIPPYQKAVKYHKSLKKLLKEKKYKIVHSHISTMSVFGLFAAKCAGVPVRIAHSHSTTNKKEIKKNILKQILKPFSKVFATDYMCCSELAGRWLFGNKEYDKGNVYLLNNAIDLDKFKYDEKVRKKKRKELNIDDDTLVIGHVGRFVEQKNHRFLIDIFNELHKEKEKSLLVLVGQGPLMNEIKEKVKKLNLENNVMFLGQRNDIVELYQVFDVFCLPSLYEGLPVVGVEAQATGLFCILSDEMTKETKVLKTTQFMSLKDTAKEWSNNILTSLTMYRRKDSTKEISNNKFNIQNEAIRLEEKYIDIGRIKVCHVVSGLKSGGVESVIYNYCSKMDNKKYEWHMLYQHKAEEKSINDFKSLNFKLKRIPSKVKKPIENYIQTKKYFKDNRIDVVHCHMTLMNFIPLIAARKTGVKVRISHSHNCFEEKNIFKKIINCLFKRMTNKNATLRIACGNDAGKYLYGSNEYIVLKNALDLDKYKYDINKRKQIRNYYEIDDTTFVIGHIGRFSYQKNHEFIIELFKKINNEISNSKLLLIGNGEEFDRIKEIAKEKKIDNNVIFTGTIKDTNYYYSAFDCFILPSRWEGLPVVGIEAQVSGVNCIFSDKIDDDVIINNSAVLLSINKLDKWFEELIRIYDINNINKRKSEYDVFIEKGFDIDTEFTKLEFIYQNNDIF